MDSGEAATRAPSSGIVNCVASSLTGLERYAQLHRYVFFRAALDEGLAAEPPEKTLPERWDEHPPPSEAQQVGNRWAASEESVALRVPSVVVPYSYNYLLNPIHPAFEAVEIGSAEPFPVDRRLLPNQ